MTLSQKFHAVTNNVFRPEYPAKMTTMQFAKDISVPYIETVSGYVQRGGFRPTTVVIYDTPQVTEKSYKAVETTWGEARKVETANGPRYQIYTVESVSPGFHASRDRTETPEAARRLLTKDEALFALDQLDRSFAATRKIAKDGAQTRKYFGNYGAAKKPPGIFKI